MVESSRGASSTGHCNEDLQLYWRSHRLECSVAGERDTVLACTRIISVFDSVVEVIEGGELRHQRRINTLVISIQIPLQFLNGRGNIPLLPDFAPKVFDEVSDFCGVRLGFPALLLCFDFALL